MKLSKSKLALAKVINENGGWPIGADWSFQPKHDYGDVWFSRGSKKPIRSGDGFNHGCFEGKWIYESIIPHKSMIDNWHQCVLSREEYHQAYPKADADGWIEWNGGECPVEKGLMVDIRVRDGREERNLAANTLTKGRNPDASWAFWKNDGVASDIIAYRPHKQDVKPEFCESVTRSIPEPESIDELCAKVTEENKHQHVDAKPTIEQLAQDYRNAKDYADRLQKEAGEASVKAESFAVEIRKKILELQELIGISKPESEPELVIADWRDLRVGDEVECVESNIRREKYNGMVGRLHSIDESYTSAPYLVDFGGAEKIWCHEVKFIRRP